MPPVETTLDAAFLRRWPLPADTEADKRRRGTVLVVGGCPATPGAVLLAGIAALRAGGGRLQLATDASVAPQLAIAVPEAIVVASAGADFEQLVGAADSVVVGPGLIDDDVAGELVDTVFARVPPEVPVVVDALALAAWRDLGDTGHSHVVVTPNKEELDQLTSDETDEPDRALATGRNVSVASFGRVALPDGRVLVDRSSPQGLGTSGSGDVLAGVIGGLAARTGDGGRSAAWGLYVHGAAAHRLARRLAPSGYLARELADEVAPALQEIDRPPTR